MATFRVVYREGFSDTVISTCIRFWRKNSRIEVYCLIVKPSVLSYTGLSGLFVPVKRNVEFIEELEDC